VLLYSCPLGTTETALKAAFPTAEEVTLVDNGEEEWYLRRASMVFPTAEIAREIVAAGGSVAGHSVALVCAGMH